MEAEKVVQISPLIRRITAGNRSVFTGPGTNTYLVGNEDVTVIDPGPAMQDHIDAILAASKNLFEPLVFSILSSFTDPLRSRAGLCPQTVTRVEIFLNFLPLAICSFACSSFFSWLLDLSHCRFSSDKRLCSLML